MEVLMKACRRSFFHVASFECDWISKLPGFCQGGLTVVGLKGEKGRTVLSSVKNLLEKGFDLQQRIKGETYPRVVFNLTGSQKTAFAGQVLGGDKPGIILTYSEEQAQKWINDLEVWLPDTKVFLFPSTEWLPFEVLGRSRETTADRIKVLSRLARREKFIIVAPVLAVERKLFSLERWHRNSVEFEVGKSCSLTDIIKKLVVMGFERSTVIEGSGQFALRGGILDIAPLEQAPVRIEFFDEEVDSIRTFDLSTQKSILHQEKVTISPVLEYIIEPEEVEQLRWEILTQGRRVLSRLRRMGKDDAYAKLNEKLKGLDERLREGILDENIYPYLGLVKERLLPFFQYLSHDYQIILDEPLRLKEQLDFQARERLEEFTHRLEHGEEFVSPEQMFITYDDLIHAGKDHFLTAMSSMPRPVPSLTPRHIFNPTARPLTGFMGKTSVLVDEITRWKETGYVVALFSGDEEHGERLIQGLKDRGLTAKKAALEQRVVGGGVYVFPYSLDQGFELPLSKLVILTEAEIYKRERKGPGKKKSSKGRGPELQISDLKAGDFVVHVQHGIGKFTGIERLSVSGSEKDYFAVQYAGEDRLYVPLDQLHLLQKYLGSDGDTTPKLYKLGGNEWNKVKSKARSAVKEMAFDLLKLYAQREQAKGMAFSPDNVWQKEFEEKFPYEETPDQLRCIEEVKTDMMRVRPMDRLLLGDVGYGKTEVALRAAFKAVMDSKQVAVLVPTTILAQQHFNTFRERFTGYPVTIEMLSRFRSPKEQKEIIRGLKDGEVDIVVGTHRLVSEGVKFKDLGLLIIDEEQRFGVAHKEKLKTLKANVDVLTLSATPIPRTLHMSMVGARDMSMIETPPEDRYPVQTYVAEFRADMVREAIRREIQREGQIFYVHNRVEDMDQVVRFLNQLVPEATVGKAHGQMSESELEREMLSFLEQEKDILVCTTIIETGLDMPNVNTLIVDEADRYGLGQLYQLRGRVGRSHRKAYAYFLYKPQKILTEVAEKRLRAIREFTEFGSGFKIAMRDLEIRGAGNIIGAQQHGHLAAVGFDLYVQMLKEAVQELKGEKVEESVDPSIEVQVDAFLPDTYITDRSLKSSLYQRMVRIRDEESLSDMLDELVDRFGTPPKEVENLLQIMRIKWKASELKIEQIQQHKQNVMVRFASDPGLSGQQFMALAAASPYPVSFGTTNNGNLELKVRIRTVTQEEILKAIEKVLRAIKDIASGSTEIASGTSP